MGFASAQNAEDLFRDSDVKIHWLGVDFSHVKLVGDFGQFNGAGDKNAIEIRDKYFPGWNRLIVDKRDKYDIKGMLRKPDLTYDLEMIEAVNADAAVEELESDNATIYSLEDIQKFVNKYKPEFKDGIGVLFIAETLNKAETHAWFHFVAINLSNRKVLVHDRIKGEPHGIGLRNYWAGSMYDVIKEIEKNRYKRWRSKYSD
jgi:hypothetical protein